VSTRGAAAAWWRIPGPRSPAGDVSEIQTSSSHVAAATVLVLPFCILHAFPFPSRVGYRTGGRWTNVRRLWHACVPSFGPLIDYK
jgi:hypothetical protein